MTATKEATETKEAEPNSSTSHSCPSPTTSSAGSKVPDGSAYDIPIIELLDSSDDEEYEIESDVVIPLVVKAVTEQLSESLSRTEGGCSKQEEPKPTSVQAESSSVKSKNNKGPETCTAKRNKTTEQKHEQPGEPTGTETDLHVIPGGI